jgi:hypothetical protein
MGGNVERRSRASAQCKRGISGIFKPPALRFPLNGALIVMDHATTRALYEWRQNYSSIADSYQEIAGQIVLLSRHGAMRLTCMVIG